MYYTSDETLEKLIKEDIPYVDLTTLILNIGKQKGKISFTSRENAVVCGTEEAVRVFNKLEVAADNFVPTGMCVEPGQRLLEARGNAEGLHLVWKVSMNILEYYSSIATRTKKLVDAVKSIDSKIEVVTTRKGLPGTKELAIKAVIAGGGLPHRLGLSETVLIFKQHMNFMGGINGLVNKIEEIKFRACEKKVIVESECREDAIRLCKAGADGLQFDKIPPSELKGIVEEIKSINPHVTLIATGGINESNIRDYAQTGVNSISTSWVYFGKPVDICTEIEKTEI